MGSDYHGNYILYCLYTDCFENVKSTICSADDNSR